MIKMNKKSKNNLNFSKDLSLNIKISSKKQDIFFKPNNTSLDFVSSPIKNNKKVIKRNTRTSSYNSFLYNQTENPLANKNNLNTNIISVDSTNKINLKKNNFAFSNAKKTLNDNSKSENNNNIKKNKKSKQNNKSQTKGKNITAHQSTSNLAKYHFNINTENNINNFINNNNSNEYINVNTNPNKTSKINLNKKKNPKNNNHSHFQQSILLNSNEFNFIKDSIIEGNNFYSFSQQDKINKEKDKLYFRNNNNTSKNLLFLTRPNLNSKKIIDKNKEQLSKKLKYQQTLNEQFFNSNIKPIDFNNYCDKSNQKNKKPFKNLNNTTKNSEDKIRNKYNINKNNNVTNLLELSTDENKKFVNEFELLYNCLKKRNDTYNGGVPRSKSGRKEKNKNLKKKKYNLLEDEDSLLGIIYENKQIKQKNEELSLQFENMKKEFEQIKKDNNEIKEELKEKTKYLKDIKLTMDIFSQELLKLQNLYKENDINKNINSNENSNLNKKENEQNNEKKNSIIEVNIKNKTPDIKITNIPKILNINNIIENTNNINNQNINNIYKKDNKIINNVSLPKKNKLEKIQQLSLNNINNLINQQNKKRGGSLEANNFQDTSKIINIETKDTTEKENECLNDKWPSPLYIEKENENQKNYKENKSNKEDGEESIDLTNISLVDNLNINQEVYNNALNMKKSNVGKLDFKNKLVKKNIEDNKFKKTPKKINLINQGIVNDNFNEEFLKYYDKFSDSWRKEVDKIFKEEKE